MKLLLMGEQSVLVEVGSPAAALSLSAWARLIGLPAADVVPGAATVLFAGLPRELAAPAALAEVLSQWPRDHQPPLGRTVMIPVSYDGPDLEFAAQRWGLSVPEAVAAHTAPDYVVAFCGFAPGFPYLAGLPAHLALPRLDTPRARVPAGAIAVADTWTGIYPSASPGGWRLLGTTEVPIFDSAADPPALLAPGTRVRLVAR